MSYHPAPASELVQDKARLQYDHFLWTVQAMTTTTGDSDPLLIFGNFIRWSRIQTIRRELDHSKECSQGILHYYLSFRLTKKSRVISKLNQLLAILGATLRRFGPIPLKSPRRPSSVTITLTASQIEVYWYPIPDIVLIWKRRRRTSLEESQFCGLSHIPEEGIRKRNHWQRICACLGNCSWDGASQ